MSRFQSSRDLYQLESGQREPGVCAESNDIGLPQAGAIACDPQRWPEVVVAETRLPANELFVDAGVGSAPPIARTGGETLDSLVQRMGLVSDPSSREFLQGWFAARSAELASSEALHVGFPAGVRPVGQAHEVTECVAHFMRALDGEDAISVFAQETGELTFREPGRICRFMRIAVDDSADGEPEDWRVHYITGLVPAGGLVALDTAVAVGQRVMFCTNDVGFAQDRLVERLEALAAELDGRTPVAGVYYSGLSGGFSDAAADEIRLIENVLGKFPLAGLFASCEMAGRRIDADAAMLTVFV